MQGENGRRRQGEAPTEDWCRASRPPRRLPVSRAEGLLPEQGNCVSGISYSFSPDTEAVTVYCRKFGRHSAIGERKRNHKKVKLGRYRDRHRSISIALSLYRHNPSTERQPLPLYGADPSRLLSVYPHTALMCTSAGGCMCTRRVDIYTDVSTFLQRAGIFTGHTVILQHVTVLILRCVYHRIRPT